ncbi:MAG: hypothetical protein AB1324_07330 [Candidatus Micrarchaeota archaeon]
MDIEAELLKSVQKEELEVLIAQKIKSFHGFLTREVALRLIAKDRGLLRNDEKEYRLADIPKGERRVRFSARVRKIWPVASYSSGKRSRVVEVEDESGQKPLILWNEDVMLGSRLRLKDKIIVKGAYEKGGELHLGYSGSIEVAERAGFSDLADAAEGDVVHVRGFVSEVEGEDSFIRDGREARGFSFMLSDGKVERRCVIFEGLDRGERLKQGDEVVIEGARCGKANIELDRHARLLSRRAGAMLLGTVRSLEPVGEGMRVDVEGKEVTFDRENALRFLGVKIADDISISTVVSLKKTAVLNSRIAVKIEEKDGQIVVRC